MLKRSQIVLPCDMDSTLNKRKLPLSTFAYIKVSIPLHAYIHATYSSVKAGSLSCDFSAVSVVVT